MSEIPYIRTSVDLAVGDTFSEVDIDYPTVIERMRSEGMTEEQIQSAQIIISANQATGDLGASLLGAYNIPDDIITLYPIQRQTLITQNLVALATDVHNLCAEYDLPVPPSDKGDALIDQQSTAVSAETSDTLYHELRHRRNHIVERPKGLYRFKLQVFGRPMAAFTTMFGTTMAAGEYICNAAHLGPVAILGTYAIAAYASIHVSDKAVYSASELYELNPDERSARQAGTEAPSDVVRMQLRPGDGARARRQARQATEVTSAMADFPTALGHIEV